LGSQSNKIIKKSQGVKVMKDRLYLNTHDPNAAAVAKKSGFGIELDDYVYFNGTEQDEGKALFDRCAELIRGCNKQLWQFYWSCTYT